MIVLLHWCFLVVWANRSFVFILFEGFSFEQRERFCSKTKNCVKTATSIFLMAIILTCTIGSVYIMCTYITVWIWKIENPLYVELLNYFLGHGRVLFSDTVIYYMYHYYPIIFDVFLPQFFTGWKDYPKVNKIVWWFTGYNITLVTRPLEDYYTIKLDGRAGERMATLQNWTLLGTIGLVQMKLVFCLVKLHEIYVLCCLWPYGDSTRTPFLLANEHD